MRRRRRQRLSHRNLRPDLEQTSISGSSSRNFFFSLHCTATTFTGSTDLRGSSRLSIPSRSPHCGGRERWDCEPQEMRSLLTECLLSEPSRHELRQVVAVPEAVLQEGNHEEDGEEPETGLPVLPSLPPLNLWQLRGAAALLLRAGIMFWAAGAQ